MHRPRPSKSQIGASLSHRHRDVPPFNVCIRAERNLGFRRAVTPSEEVAVNPEGVDEQQGNILHANTARVIL